LNIHNADSSSKAIEENESSTYNSPDPSKRVKFAESLVTYAADNSSSGTS